MQNDPSTPQKNIKSTSTRTCERTPENKRPQPYNQSPDYKPRDQGNVEKNYKIPVS
jgi:hypothetical protein